MTEFIAAKLRDNDSLWRDRNRVPIDASNSKHELDRRLDQALEDTFPASDAVSIVISG